MADKIAATKAALAPDPNDGCFVAFQWNLMGFNDDITMILLTNITIHVWDGNHDTQMCCKSCGSRMQPIVTVVIYHCEVCPRLSSQVKPCQATVQPCAAAAKTCQHADTQNVSSVLFTSPYRKQQSFTLIDHPSSDRHLRIPDLNRVHNIRKFAISQAAQLQTAPCWRNCRPPLGLEAPEVTELSLLLLLPSRQALVGVHWGWNKAPWCAWNTVSLLDQWAKTWHGFINEQKKEFLQLKKFIASCVRTPRSDQVSWLTIWSTLQRPWLWFIIIHHYNQPSQQLIPGINWETSDTRSVLRLRHASSGSKVKTTPRRSKAPRVRVLLAWENTMTGRRGPTMSAKGNQGIDRSKKWTNSRGRVRHLRFPSNGSSRLVLSNGFEKSSELCTKKISSALLRPVHPVILTISTKTPWLESQVIAAIWRQPVQQASTGAILEPKAPGSGRLFKGCHKPPPQSIATNRQPLDSTDTQKGRDKDSFSCGEAKFVPCNNRWSLLLDNDASENFEWNVGLK